jgi:hypothetical protein
MAVTNLDTLVANIGAVLQPAEHGAGAIGTSGFGAPRTYRRIEDGVIITQVKIDITGLYDGGTANDAIGLATATACKIGRNVVATNGVIFKAELSCIEVPAGGDPDINVVRNASGTIQGDAAAGTAYVSGNSGDLAAGNTIQNLVPVVTADEYYYLACGTSTGATYTAGMLIFTTWGHPLLI